MIRPRWPFVVALALGASACRTPSAPAAPAPPVVPTVELSGFPTEPLPEPDAVLEVSDPLTNDVTDPLVIHVHLQVHQPHHTQRDGVDTLEIDGIQQRIVRNVVALAHRGAVDIVAEGLLQEDWVHPAPRPPAARGRCTNSVCTLSRIRGLHLWGFEDPITSEWVVPMIVDSIPAGQGRFRSPGTTWRDRQRLNLWISQVMIEGTARSSRALSMALERAFLSEAREAQIIIGAGHRDDFEYLQHARGLRLVNVRLLLYDYASGYERLRERLRGTAEPSRD